MKSIDQGALIMFFTGHLRHCWRYRGPLLVWPQVTSIGVGPLPPPSEQSPPYD